MARLEDGEYPGNVRQLRGVVEYPYVIAEAPGAPPKVARSTCRMGSVRSSVTGGGAIRRPIDKRSSGR